MLGIRARLRVDPTAPFVIEEGPRTGQEVAIHALERGQLFSIKGSLFRVAHEMMEDRSGAVSVLADPCVRIPSLEF